MAKLGSLRLVASGKLARCDICQTARFRDWCAQCHKRVCYDCSEERSMLEAEDDFGEVEITLCRDCIKKDVQK